MIVGNGRQANLNEIMESVKRKKVGDAKSIEMGQGTAGGGEGRA